MTTTTDTRLDVLPKWAQHYISELKTTIDDHAAEAAYWRKVASDKVVDDGTAKVVEERGFREDPRPLKDNAQVTWRFDDDGWQEITVERQGGEGPLRVSAKLGGLTVRPVASNVVEITTGDRV